MACISPDWFVSVREHDRMITGHLTYRSNSRLSTRFTFSEMYISHTFLYALGSKRYHKDHVFRGIMSATKIFVILQFLSSLQLAPPSRSSKIVKGVVFPSWGPGLFNSRADALRRARYLGRSASRQTRRRASQRAFRRRASERAG